MRSFADEAGREHYAHGPVVIDDLPNDPTWRARPLREHGVVSSADGAARAAPTPPPALLGAHSRTRRTFSEPRPRLPHAPSRTCSTARCAPAHGGAPDPPRRAPRRAHRAAQPDAAAGAPHATRSARADAEGRQLALFFLDVDHLKVLNDSLGHHAGDELLRAIGPRLRSVLRPDGHDRPLRRRRVRRAVRRHRRRGAARCASPSGSCARSPSRSRSAASRASARPASASWSATPTARAAPEELLSDADAALYRAKERGRGRHEVFDVGLRDRITTRLRIEDDLRRAIDVRRPAVGRLPAATTRCPSAAVAGVEALLRWTHPERGAIPPARVHPRRRGLRADRRARRVVLRTACAQVAELGRAG